MKKRIILMASLTVLSSCGKEIGSVENRWPQKIDFKERVLDAGTMVGSEISSVVQEVELGLSVKWANVNLGVQNADEQGDHYAWGEIESGDKFGWCYYEHNDSAHSCSSILYLTKYCFDKYGEINDVEPGAELHLLDDAAYIKWGDGWRMPSAEEFEELIKECEWYYDKAEKTFTAKGPNGNSIQFPAPGYSFGNRKYSSEQSNAYATGAYWTRELSEFSSADAKIVMMSAGADGKVKLSLNPGFNRCFGLPIRPVKE